MSKQQVATVVRTVHAVGAIAECRAVARNGSQATDGTSSAGVNIIGFADTAAADGDNFKLNVGPTSWAEAGAAIDGTELRLKTDANGRVIPWSSGGIVAAILKQGQTATAAGQIVEVIPVVS